MRMERKQAWNEQQKRLQDALLRGKDRAETVRLFLDQHAMVHAGVVSGYPEPTFEDEVWDGLAESDARCVPPGFEHSIAWMAWHLARCEDITMNLLVAGTSQVMEAGWAERMGIPFRDTGNAMDATEGSLFNAAVDIAALRDYRGAVARRTREIVQALPEGAFRQPVDPARAAQIIPSGAVLEAARGLVEYWGSRTVAGLLLMPATRHNLVHWNEAEKVKRKLARAATASSAPGGN